MADAHDGLVARLLAVQLSPDVTAAVEARAGPGPAAGQETAAGSDGADARGSTSEAGPSTSASANARMRDDSPPTPSYTKIMVAPDVDSNSEERGRKMGRTERASRLVCVQQIRNCPHTSSTL